MTDHMKEMAEIEAKHGPRGKPISSPMDWLKSQPGYWVGRAAVRERRFEASLEELLQRCEAGCYYLIERGKLEASGH